MKPLKSIAMQRTALFVLACVYCWGGCLGAFALADAFDDTAQQDPVWLIVMDPLSAPLACDCVEGYAQRKYEDLGNFLARELKRPVKVVWGDSIKECLEETGGQAHLIVGKHSVVEWDAKQLEMPVDAVASLTGKEGETTQTGLIVVRSSDTAQKTEDLNGYRLFFGPRDCDEKYAAPMALLKKAKVELPKELEISSACSEAAVKLVQLDKDIPAAAIISSYAKPLLEGCGSVKKGDLRVIGESDPVPFITAFVHQQIDTQLQSEITHALLKMGDDPKLLISLESDVGFIEYEPLGKETDSKAEKKK